MGRTRVAVSFNDKQFNNRYGMGCGFWVEQHVFDVEKMINELREIMAF